jgi:hypothetical protein
MSNREFEEWQRASAEKTARILPILVLIAGLMVAGLAWLIG